MLQRTSCFALEANHLVSLNPPSPVFARWIGLRKCGQDAIKDGSRPFARALSLGLGVVAEPTVQPEHARRVRRHHLADPLVIVAEFDAKLDAPAQSPQKG